MVFISIITIIAAKALPVFKKISSIHISRIASIIFIYTGASSFNCLYIQSIGSGIGIYSGLFHITPISQIFFTSAPAPAPASTREVTILPTIEEHPKTTNPLDPDNIFGLQFKFEGGI